MSTVPAGERNCSAEQLRSPALILRYVRDSIIVTDLLGSITYWNDGATALFGYTAEEMLGRTPELLFPDQEPGRLREDLAAILAGHDYVGERQRRRKDGTPVWIEITTTRLANPAGAVIGFIGTAKDITARKRADEQRRLQLAATDQALRQQAALLALAPDAIIVRNPDGTIVRWNAGAEALYGWPATEVEGQITHDLLRTRVLSTGSGMKIAMGATGRAIDAVLAATGSWEGLIEQIRRDGERVVVESRQALLRDEGGRPVAILVVNRDVTARDAFLSGIAHDIKNPLTTILGHAQLAARRLTQISGPAATTATEHLRQIQASTKSVVRLVDELADLVHLQMGATFELEPRPTDLVALARAVVAQHQGSTDHLLVVETTLESLGLALDARRVERVLGNVLSNAIKYSPTASTITVSLGLQDNEHGPGVTILVRDQGVGIPAADLPHIFERFRRARNVVGVVPGTGIGLATVRAIIEQHGGTVSVESVEGRGTTMGIWLPRTPDATHHGTGDAGHACEEAGNG
jgi:PAS domain S-box-containing protein